MRPETPEATPPAGPRWAESRFGMVATAHPGATEAGIRMLAEGGNAIDAAVAAAFALGVCEPAGSGLGGQTMMMIHLAGPRRTIALDGSSRVPHRVTVDVVSAEECASGYRATTVPSTPAVLRHALERYGNLRLSHVLEPAIHLAEHGYAVTELQHRLAVREARRLRKGNAAALFLDQGKRPHPVGFQFRQPVLARTLRRMARHGVKDFYSGSIARRIHEDMERNRGLIRKDDLAQVPKPRERPPLTGEFLGSTLYAFPPPGAGRTLLRMAAILSHLPTECLDLDRPEGAVAVADVIRKAYQERKDFPLDPDLYLQSRLDRALGPDVVHELAAEVLAKIPGRQGETTHLSVMDRHGNAVALTQSIEKVYGAAVATPDLGFLYNNYLGTMVRSDIAHPYYLRPNAVPWASVAPTLVFRKTRPWMAIGSPGSDRIAPAILQVLLRLQRLPPFEAVAAPRLHCSTEGVVSLEAARMPAGVCARLRRRGFRIKVRDPFAFYLGSVQMVLRDRARFIGVADPRRDGTAGGPHA